MREQKPQILLGAHMSIASGIELAPACGRRLGCTVIQLFVKSTTQWRARPLCPQEVEAFRENLIRNGLATAFGHGAYLPNLASPDRTLRTRSAESVLEEVKRADLLGLPFLVIHPGAHLGEGEARGIRRIADSLDWILEKAYPAEVRIALETTAGQGSSVGWRFEHLADIIDRVEEKPRMGVCLDTYHLHAAGYDMRVRKGYLKVMKEVDAVIGIDRVLALHLNDSLAEFGSRVDRHAHIGRGTMGLEPFRLLMNDKRFRAVPKVIETPKGKGDYHDRRNLRILKNLVRVAQINP